MGKYYQLEKGLVFWIQFLVNIFAFFNLTLNVSVVEIAVNNF